MSYCDKVERIVDNAAARLNMPAIQQICKSVALPGCIGAACLLAPPPTWALVGAIALGSLNGMILYRNTSETTKKIRQFVLCYGTTAACILYGGIRGTILHGPVEGMAGLVIGGLVGYPLGYSAAITLGNNTNTTSYTEAVEEIIDNAVVKVNMPTIQKVCKYAAIPVCIGAGYVLAPPVTVAKIGACVLGALTGMTLFKNASETINKVKQAVLCLGTTAACTAYGALRGYALGGPVGGMLGGVWGTQAGYPLGYLAATILGDNTATRR